ncbi:MAG TPA: hypothetical protein VN749_22450 [Candidatus Eisenbacteria bacterium]|jgi:hypothetical protein|nr:hypothetical protein [Candidatus Eisenbacteria bacterium]
MLSENQAPAPVKNRLNNPLLYTSLLMLLAAIYAGWVFLSRHARDRAYEQRLERQQSQKQREADQTAIEQLGGNKLSIQMLYATPELRRGETAQVCFGVANAKSVKLEPQTSPVWPSHNLCVEVKPVKTTVYTLTASGADGQTVAQQVTVRVR